MNNLIAMAIDWNSKMIPALLFWGGCWLWSLFTKPYEEDKK